ncbi:unnamed protein product [Microthlaspi erraticum]|uniref:YDG domain-containing protein n=1 Tax=Microthlaspi erraticum TaxID=1685480 RepID=A0A6D2ITG2_9BRAS|nr:unnamed protein product [Microthlaspi erraticum]
MSLVRDLLYGRGTQTIKNQRSENDMPESLDVIMKKAGFGVAASNAGRRRFVSTKIKFPTSCGSKVKPLSYEKTVKLIASQRQRRQLQASSTHIQRKFVVQNQANSPEKKKMKTFNNAALRSKKTHQPNQNRDERRSNPAGRIPVIRQNQITKVLSPRGRVLKVLRSFNILYNKLDRDQEVRSGESKTAIDCKTWTILKSKGMQVNAKKMIGAVPGIEVGDEFQYKAELSLIGLHFNIMSGIDYVDRGDTKLATSIVSSEGNGYVDIFHHDLMIYSGQGGTMTSKGGTMTSKDQKLVMGNLALANSMKAKTPVRVIRGKKRLDQRGKHYVYVGLYLVQDYWQEKGPQGNVLFKFKLCRISGQPFVDLDT